MLNMIYFMIMSNIRSGQNGMFIKDLWVIQNWEQSSIIIVDNSACCFGLNIDNGIPIIPFYDNMLDTELLELEDYLVYLSRNDIMQTNRNIFKI